MMDEIVRWRAQVVRARAAAIRARMEALAAKTVAATARCADRVAQSQELTIAARSRAGPGDRVDAVGSAPASEFDRLQAEAMATAGGQSAAAARLLVHRLAQGRPGDAAARSALDATILGAWGRLEQRARARLGPDAPPERLAHELIHDLGLDST